MDENHKAGKYRTALIFVSAVLFAVLLTQGIYWATAGKVPQQVTQTEQPAETGQPVDAAEAQQATESEQPEQAQQSAQAEEQEQERRTRQPLPRRIHA